MKRDVYEEYAKNAAEGLKLYAPSIDDISSAEKYGDYLEENYARLYELKRENDRLLRMHILPLLNADKELTEEDEKNLLHFADILQNSPDLEYFDIHLLWLVSDRLFADACLKSNPDYLVEQCYFRMVAAMSRMTQLKYLSDAKEELKKVMEAGKQAINILFSYLEKDKFGTLSTESSKTIVIINSRFFCALFKTPNQDEKTNDYIIDKLIASYELDKDEFYREAVPGYDWKRHKIKTVEYMGRLAELGNESGYTKEQITRIYPYLKKLQLEYEHEPEEIKKILSLHEIAVMCARAEYYAGYSDVEEYKDTIVRFFRDREGQCNEVYAVYSNFELPGEYIGIIEQQIGQNHNINEKDIAILESFYRSMISSAYQMPNRQALTAAIEYMSSVMIHYVELPAGLSFDKFCKNFYGALHPAIYVHVLMVARVSRCLCGYLIKYRPELFIGVLGCTSVTQVLASKNEIVGYVYHAALVRDIGKLPILPIVATYTRELFDAEKELYNKYIAIGQKVARRKISTKKYAHIPEILSEILDFSCKIEEATSCLQKERAMTLGVFLSQMEDGANVPPYILELFEASDVTEDMEYLLTKGRKQNYIDAYITLKEVQDRGKI